MAELVLLYGRSGSGKSCSARNFDNLFLVNINDKRPPYALNKELKQVVWSNHDYDKIKQQMLKANAAGYNAIMLDDAGYLLTNDYMTKPSTVVGNQVFDFYDKLSKKFFDLIYFIKNSLNNDTIVYLVMHEDFTDNGYSKLKTIGRQLDDKVCIEGLATVALRAVKRDKSYVFCTNTDGLDITKSPFGMFDELYIENDLKKVDTIIRNYWGFKPHYVKVEPQTKEGE